MQKARSFPFTKTYLRSRLHYNKKTGIFTWKFNPSAPAKWNGRWVGKQAGCIDNGYVIIRFDYANYFAHRLAWFYVYGEQPDEVDHEDTIKNHNWIDNLRPATTGQNAHNRPANRNSSSGFKGVSRNGKNWVARIMIKGKPICIGTYARPETASKAYIRAAKKYHKDFARWE